MTILKVNSFLESWRSIERKAPVLFTLSSVSVSLSQMISSIVIARYIDPKELGLWQSVNLALTYAMFLLVGLQNGLSRELPYYLGAKDENSAKRLAGTTLFYTSGACVLVILCGVGYTAILFFEDADTRTSYAVVAVTLLIILQFYQNYLFVTFRSHNSFLALSGIQTWQAISAILTLPLLYFLRYDGMLIRTVFVAGLVVYFMHRFRPVVASPSWSKDSFVVLLKTGVPIFALDYIRSCAGTFDRVALLHFGGVEQVGLYSLALSTYGALQVVPFSIAHYIYPRMTYRYAQTGNPKLIWDMAWKATLLAVGLLASLACIGWFLLPPVVSWLFPKYVAGTYAAQVMLFAAAAAGATIAANALLSMKAWSHILVYQLSLSSSLAVGPFVAIQVFSLPPITGVACGMLAANLLGLVLSLTITFDATHRWAQQPAVASCGGTSVARFEIQLPKATTVD